MTEERVEITHRPGRPSWRCGVDGDEWPCDVARREVAGQYRGDRAALTSHVVFLMRRAADELRPADPTRLYRRFVAWTLGHDVACRACGRPGHDLAPNLPPRFVPCDGRAAILPSR